MDTPEKYRKEVENAIRQAMAMGNCTEDSILPYVYGADVRLVHEIITDLKKCGTTAADVRPSTEKAASARRASAYLPLRLPAPDPLRSQWWFTLDAVEKLAEAARGVSGGGPVTFLGAPTVGYYFNTRYETMTTILDADDDVIKCLGQSATLNAITYDAVDELPESVERDNSVVVIDPPWYPEQTRLFIARANEILVRDGHIFCVIPPRLTRPGIGSQRTGLLKELLSCGFEVISVESGFVSYRVPTFETKAFEDIKWFSTMPWRGGDLLAIKANDGANLHVDLPAKKCTSVFARNPSRMRVFQRSDVCDTKQTEFLQPIEDFSRNVSSRSYDGDEISVWTSDQRAGKVKDSALMTAILSAWKNKAKKEAVIESLAEAHPTDNVADSVESADKCLGLWSDADVPKTRRTMEQMEDLQSRYQTHFASAKPTGRPDRLDGDGFRLDFQRDRDRVLWSQSLKRLASKSQMYSANGDSSLRRRLSHSIEVMQLASTISTSFGLNRDLTEAGALAHDLGHTPFGHAGEDALNKALDAIAPEFGGFSHYEHGVDVVRWLENVYRSPGADGVPGLNLTYETMECIMKHTFSRSLQSTVIGKSKYKDIINDDGCHLEGQAVRIADKISYLISDLEDGIAMGALNLGCLGTCRFFYRPPIDMTPSRGEDLYDRFISQRRSILKVIMEDVLNSTEVRLSRLKDIAEVRRHPYYAIDFSPELGSEIKEIWDNLQTAILHKEPLVVQSNMRAANVVRPLLYLYAFVPRLVNPKFAASHDGLMNLDYGQHYFKRLGQEIGLAKRLVSNYPFASLIGSSIKQPGDNYQIGTWDVVRAKDYVASLTDSEALSEFRKHLESREG